MNPNPIRPRRHLRSGDFSIRTRGAWAATMLDEEDAWRLFLIECQGGGHVELLRGVSVVAWLKPALGGIS
jgi:hypothetical protein